MWDRGTTLLPWEGPGLISTREKPAGVYLSSGGQCA